MQGNPTRQAWYLVQIKPQSYRIAERNLERQGFQTFCPQISKTGPKNGRFVTRAAPLFPGYLFVFFELPSAAPRKINATLGVARLVSLAGRPAEVPEAIIDGLRARCDGDGLLSESPSVAVGDEVTLLTGPFADFVGTVDRIDPSRRIWVLIDLLGRETRVALDEASWRAA